MLEHSLLQLAGKRPRAHQRVQELPVGCTVERTQGQLLRSMRQPSVRSLLQRPGPVFALRPHADHEKDRG